MLDNTIKDWIDSFYRFLKSIKLAIVLILLITIMSIISTFVPQGQPQGFYTETYSGFISRLILSLHFDDFFKSLLFFFPTALFFINLAVCSISRFVTRMGGKAKKRFGPDILHLGLLILIIGSIVSGVGRKEGYFEIGIDDHIKLPGGYVLYLTNCEYLTYESGNPSDWISTVDIKKDGELIIEGFRIEVNNPLKVGNMKLYQYSYSQEARLIIKDSAGTEYSLSPKNYISVDDKIMIFKGVERINETPIAYFDQWVDHEITGREFFRNSDYVGEYRIKEIISRDLTGLQVVTDPGYTTVFIAFILLTFGIFLTYIQKIGDKKL